MSSKKTILGLWKDFCIFREAYRDHEGLGEGPIEDSFTLITETIQGMAFAQGDIAGKEFSEIYYNVREPKRSEEE